MWYDIIIWMFSFEHLTFCKIKNFFMWKQQKWFYSRRLRVSIEKSPQIYLQSNQIEFWASHWSSDTDDLTCCRWVGDLALHCLLQKPLWQEIFSAHFLCQSRWGRTHKHTLWFTLTHTIICIRDWIEQTVMAQLLPLKDCSSGSPIRVMSSLINLSYRPLLVGFLPQYLF